MAIMKFTINITLLKKYLRNNLGVPFLILFQLSLLSSAILWIRGNIDYVNDLSLFSYLSLAIGVIIQVLHSRREKNGY